MYHMHMRYDVGIVGNGPVGLTAAIYTSRAFLKTLVLTGIVPGGQLTTTTDVDNFPGFPGGIKGPQLVADMQKQAERFGTEVKQISVVGIRSSDKAFTIKTTSGDIETRSVIVATGASAKYLGLASETKFLGKGVSACATCDGFFFRGKRVMVVGGGDTAMEEATFLTTFAEHVTIVHRRDTFRASPIMLERAKKNPNISFVTNKTIDEILGDAVVRSVRLKDAVSGKMEEMPVDGVFLAIGHKPSTDFLQGFVNLDERGYVMLTRPSSTLEAQTATNVPGIFAAGDCVDPLYRQAVVAAGMGSMAALDVQRWLSEQA